MLAPHGILTGYRGPRGGYRLAREPSDISVEDILRSVGSMEDDSTRSLLPIGHC
ncbi:MAG: Rrf2 family transcriptional regulator [Xanthobacteraceae bacterium]